MINLQEAQQKLFVSGYFIKLSTTSGKCTRPGISAKIETFQILILPCIIPPSPISNQFDTDTKQTSAKQWGSGQVESLEQRTSQMLQYNSALVKSRAAAPGWGVMFETRDIWFGRILRTGQYTDPRLRRRRLEKLAHSVHEVRPFLILG